MKMRKLVLFGILVFGSFYVFAQMPQPQKFLPVLAPSSPEAAAFNRYGNYQINYFTGIPDISIPLYDIKVGELNIPVSINYHSSGIKVSDVPSRVGLGWDLQAGGSITRKIMGKPDELPGNYMSATSTSNNRVKTQTEIDPTTQAGIDYLHFVDVGTYDVEPDIFSYNFPGHAGKMLFNQKSNFNAVLIPYAPINVSMVPTMSNISFGITDESGIKYRFDSTEWTNSGIAVNTVCTSAWMLSDVISSNQQDSIHLRYATKSGGGITDSYYSDYLVLNDNCTGSYTSNCTTTGTFSSDYNTVLTTWKQLSEIDFRNGKVVFEAGPETRADFSSAYQLQNRINAIKIYSLNPLNNSFTLIKSIQFFQSYFINGTDISTKRLRLDSIQILMSNGTVAQSYQFAYNTSVALPSKDSRMKDYWGYFNNVTNLDPYGNPTMIPKMQVQYNIPNSSPSTIWIGGNQTNARDPDPNYMQAYILQKITYPTGGNTQFEYETNQYLDGSGNPKYAGGLRIKTIKSYTDNVSTPIVKSFKYGLNESGYGRNNFFLEDHFFVSVQNIQGCDANQSSTLISKTTRTYFSNPTNDLESYDGSPVVYSNVSEYIGNGTTFAGKTMYRFSDKVDGKTTMIGYGKPILTSYHFVRGLLNNKSDYRINADNSYSIVAENRKGYQYFPFQNSTGGIGLVVYKSKIFDGYSGLLFSSPCQTSTDSYNYLYNNYEIVTGDNKLIADTSIAYDQNDQTKYNSVITSYNYDDVTHLQVTQSQFTNSKSQIIASAYTYPYNYSSAPYTNMTANHMFNKVITDTKTNNGNPLTLQTNTYASFAGNNYLVSNVQLKVATNTPETRANFNQYDIYGNIQEQQKTNDIKEVYLWSYKSMYPVAKVIGSSYSAVIAVVPQSQIDAAVSSDVSMRTVLNNLRIGLPTALVTTYTYAPLVGMTSQTDPAGRTTYYEYDGLGRLSLIRDQDQNILKKYEYQYQSTSTAIVPPTIYSSQVQSGTYTRNNCGTGYTGSSVLYTVPAGTYTSIISLTDANSKAQTDVTTNGQTYANTYGTCTSSSVSCSIVMNSGYSSATSSVTKSGTTVSGYIVFYATSSAMTAGTMYQIASIGTTCAPTATRTFTTSAGGRTWTVTVYSSGQIYAQMASGSATLNTYSTISLNLSYSQ